jgi:hypothetical protein
MDICYFQQFFIYIEAVNFIGRGNREYPEKTTDLPQVTDKLYHICCIEKTTDLPQVTDKLYHICCIKYTSP